MEVTEARLEHVREQFESPADLTEAKFFQLVAYIARLEEGIIDLAVARDKAFVNKGAELERLQAENAALRATVTSYRRVLREIRKEAVGINSTGVVELMHYDAETIIALTDGALQMMGEPKPDAAPVEPAPAPAREIAVGDSVRITREDSVYQGVVGTLVGIVPLADKPYMVDLPSASYGDSYTINDYTRDEIEPA